VVIADWCPRRGSTAPRRWFGAVTGVPCEYRRLRGESTDGPTNRCHRTIRHVPPPRPRRSPRGGLRRRFGNGPVHTAARRSALRQTHAHRNVNVACPSPLPRHLLPTVARFCLAQSRRHQAVRGSHVEASMPYGKPVRTKWALRPHCLP